MESSAKEFQSLPLADEEIQLDAEVALGGGESGRSPTVLGLLQSGALLVNAGVRGGLHSAGELAGALPHSTEIPVGEKERSTVWKWRLMTLPLLRTPSIRERRRGQTLQVATGLRSPDMLKGAVPGTHWWGVAIGGGARYPLVGTG